MLNPADPAHATEINPPVQENPNPAINPGPSENAPDVSKLAARLVEQSRAAIRQHNNEQVPKRGRGRPAKNRVPVEILDNDPIPLSVGGEAEAGDLSADFRPDVTAVDEKTVTALAQALPSLIENLGSTAMWAFIFAKTRDDAFAEKAAARCKMSDESKNLIAIGGEGCLRKYFKRLEYAPETALGVGAGLYGVGLILQAVTLKKDLKKIQEAVTN